LPVVRFTIVRGTVSCARFEDKICSLISMPCLQILPEVHLFELLLVVYLRKVTSTASSHLFSNSRHLAFLPQSNGSVSVEEAEDDKLEIVNVMEEACTSGYEQLLFSCHVECREFLLSWTFSYFDIYLWIFRYFLKCACERCF